MKLKIDIDRKSINTGLTVVSSDQIIGLQTIEKKFEKVANRY